MDLKHILALPASMTGHLSPFLNLCCRFASRNFCERITFIITEDKIHSLQEMLQQLEASGDLPQGLASTRVIPAAFPTFFTGGEEAVIRAYKDMEEVAHAAELVAADLSKECKLTCVLGEFLISWPQIIANQLNLPLICLHTLALAEMAIVLHMPTLIAQGSFDPFKDLSVDGNKLINVPGLPPLLASDIPQVSQYPSSNTLYWNYILARCKQARAATVVLSNSCYELEGKAFEAIVENHRLPLKFVGPLLTPPSKLPQASSCLSWLDMQPQSSVIYVSFGSFLQWKSSELEEVLLGIKESGYPSLLAFRQDVLVDKPSSRLEAFLKEFRNSKQGLIVDWAPQREVLTHSSTGVFFTHYGWNSVSESISAGVPLIGKPALGDQFVMRKMAIHEWKIAVEIVEDSEGRMSKEAVKAAVVNLMQNTEIRKNAAHLKESIAKTLSKGGRSYSSIDELVL